MLIVNIDCEIYSIRIDRFYALYNNWSEFIEFMLIANFHSYFLRKSNLHFFMLCHIVYLMLFVNFGEFHFEIKYFPFDLVLFNHLLRELAE